MTGIPEGWVCMASYDDRQDKRHGNPGDRYRLLLSAAKSHQIRVQTIPGVRGMLVLKDEADSFLAKRKAATRPEPAEGQSIDLTQYEAMRTLQRIETALLRIADAAEAMATRPG